LQHTVGASPPGGEALAGPADELSSVGLAGVEDLGDQRVRVLERLAKDVGGPLGGQQAPEQDEPQLEGLVALDPQCG
jgi:hypothetical protein